MQNKNIVILCIFITISCNNIVFGDDDRRISMNASPVTVKLEAEVKSGDLVATLIFQNTLTHPIFLDKHTASLTDEPTSRLFEITDIDGNLINYKGLQVKRKFNKNDFVELKSGASVKATVILNDWYKFHDGNHVYSILYTALNHSYDKQKLFEMTSNETLVKYNRK